MAISIKPYIIKLYRFVDYENMSLETNFMNLAWMVKFSNGIWIFLYGHFIKSLNVQEKLPVQDPTSKLVSIL